MTKPMIQLLFLFCFGVMGAQLTFAEQPTPHLTEKQRHTLRFHLQNIFNEFDLLIRNQKVDEADLAKQGRTITALKIYERIPFAPQLDSLRKQLAQSAQASQIKLLEFKSLQVRPSRLAPMPKTLTHQDGFFRPKPHQLVQEIPFQIRVSGNLAQIEAWTRSWKEDLMRLAELEHLHRGSPSQPAQYLIRAHAFQFKKVEFPKIIPPRAKDYLPKWAAQDPDLFSQQEPLLWDLITQSDRLRPLTPPLYQKRGKFLLEGGRIDFFLSKAMPSSNQQGPPNRVR